MGMEIRFRPIGVIRSPFRRRDDIPFQGCRSEVRGRVEIFRKYEKALSGIEGFSHVYLLYYFHGHGAFSPMVRPFLDDRKRDLFATRHFNRPNPIGISVVELLERRGNVLKVGNVDVLNKTPLLDIKPYVPAFDQRDGCKIGWLEGKT